MPGIFQNILFDQSILQMTYNVIHWILGLGLITFAVIEYVRLNNKKDRKNLFIRAPQVFMFNGLFFILYVILGHVIYINLLDLEWLFEHEHVIHVAIGALFFAGGLIELLYRKKVLKHMAWRLGIPLSLVLSGLLFLHPQHGLGSVLEYMTIYHRVLGASLIISGISLGMSVFFKSNKYLWKVALLLVVATGITFIAYRHQYNTMAECRVPGTIHEVTLTDDRVAPAKVNATLCDTIRFVSGDNKPHYVGFGEHSHHSSLPGFTAHTLESRGESQEMVLQLSGKFMFHDHFNHHLHGVINVERPQNLDNWYVEKL
jgi:plastocyanin